MAATSIWAASVWSPAASASSSSATARATGVRRGLMFSDGGAGELLLYEDSARQLALAVNEGSAAALLGLTVDDELRISS